jgi:hypothetical protein
MDDGMNALVEIPNVPTREQIFDLERAIAMHPNRVEELQVFHHFADGMYARELHIPAGVVLTGEIHKTQHLAMVAAGSITVWTEDGMKRLDAPSLFVSQPGAKRAGYAHEYTVFITFHATTETDPEKIREAVIEPSDNLVGYEYGCQFIEEKS